MTDQNNEEVYEIDPEQLQELLDNGTDDKLPPIVIPYEWYDEKAFHKGIQDISYLCGEITGLLNVGLSEQAVMDFLLNRETIKHNLDTARINRDMNIEIAKNQKIVAEKNEL